MTDHPIQLRETGRARALLGVALLAPLAGCSLLRPFEAEAVQANFAYDPTFPIRRLEVPNVSGYAAVQSEPVWCWAACAAMVRSYDESGGRARGETEALDLAALQAEIVARIQQRGGTDPARIEAASRSEVLGALDVELYEELLETEERVESSVMEAFMTALLASDDDDEEDAPEDEQEGPEDPEPDPPQLGFDSDRLYRELSGAPGRGPRPVVAALRGLDGTGHVVVVTGAHCQALPTAPDPASGGAAGTEYRFMAIRFFDPTKDPPGTTEPFGGEYWLAGSEFAARCDFLASKASAAEYLRFLKEHAEWAERNFGMPAVAPDMTATP